MTHFKKFVWSGAFVALAMIMATTMLVQTAYAAGTVSSNSTATVRMALNAATGTGTYTAVAADVVFTGTVAGDFAVGNIVIQAPGGWQFNPAATVTAVAAGAGTATVTSPATVSATGSTITVAVTAASTGAATITLALANVQVRPLTTNAATGNITVATSSGLGAGPAVGTNVGTLTRGTEPATTGTLTLTPTVASLTTTGTDVGTVGVLLSANDGGGALNVGSTQVSCTSTLGYLATTLGGAISSTSSTVTVTTPVGGGNVNFFVRSNGTAGTDSIVCTAGSPAAVGEANISMTTGAAGTATTLSFVTATNNGDVAASKASAVPAYTSPSLSANVTFRVVDAAGIGVTGQVLQVSTDKGRLISGHGGVCSTATAKVVTATTATTGFGGGAGTTAVGRAGVTFCPLSAAAEVGTVTITAKNLQTTMADATGTLTAAGPAATIETAFANGALTVTAKDAAGNLVANGTEFTLTIASTVGSAAPATIATVNGAGTFAVALNAATGNAIVTVRDTAAGTVRLTQSVTLSATGTTPTPTPTPGDGTFASAPTFGTGTAGMAVFNGGTVEQLAAAVTAAGGTSVWVQDANGTWRVMVVGAAAFINAGFNASFPTGFAGATAVSVVK